MVLLALVSYLLGSIPFGFLAGLACGKDVRCHGSMNIGATNVWRVCGKYWGLAVFVLDFLKGLVAVAVAAELFATGAPPPYPGIVAALAVVLGHNFPVWLKFKGGKGVATSAGAVAGLMWLPFVIAFGVFFLIVLVFKYISLGSMLASVALVVAVIFCVADPFGANLPLLLLSAALCAMLLVRHRKNISRIIAGTESKFPPPKQTGT